MIETMIKHKLSAIPGVLLLSLFTAPISAAQGQTYLVTICNENYPSLGSSCHLKYAADDAEEVVTRLRDHNRIVTEENILRLTPDTPDPERTPSHKNITTSLPEFLQQTAKEDTIILFVSLQGARIRDSVTGRFEGYLLPSDVDPIRMGETVISLNWLKEQLLAAHAENVVLFLDASHSGSLGSSPGTNTEILTSNEIKKVFHQNSAQREQAKNFYTIVSCDEGESSRGWPEKKQSIFAWWLCQGLDGAADTNADSLISLDELYDFLEKEVPLTAAMVSDSQQVPQRFLLGNYHSNPKLFPLNPEPAKNTLKRLADLVDALVRNHLQDSTPATRPRVSVLEFATLVDTRTLKTGPTAELRGAVGSFGAISRDIIERHLTGMSKRHPQDHRFSVIPSSSLDERLRSLKLTDVMTAKLNVVRPGVDAIVYGTITRLGGDRQSGPDRLLLDVRLLQLAGENDPPHLMGHVTSTVLVDDELWSLLGGEDRVRLPSPETSAPAIIPVLPSVTAQEKGRTDVAKPPATSPSTTDTSERAISPALTNSDRRHNTPDGVESASVRSFAVEVFTGDTAPLTPVIFEKQETPAGPANNFRVTKGNRLEMRVSNTTDRWLAMIAMVDGYNVIGKQRELPSEARYWLIPPKGKGVLNQWLSGKAELRSDGNGTESQKFNGRDFTIVSAPESVAMQQGFSEQLGEIRILVYETEETPPAEISRAGTPTPSVGIGEGTHRTSEFPIYRDRKIDFRNPPEKHVFHYYE